VLGWQEVILIFILLIFVVGPTRLPQLARELGKVVREFNKATAEIAEAVQSPTTGVVQSPLKTGAKRKVGNKRLGVARSVQLPSKMGDRRNKELLDIAKKLNITTQGKTSEQVSQEIITKIESKEKASDTKAVKR
jgi:sec-independent protein translocase protein TatA